MSDTLTQSKDVYIRVWDYIYVSESRKWLRRDQWSLKSVTNPAVTWIPDWLRALIRVLREIEPIS